MHNGPTPALLTPAGDAPPFHKLHTGNQYHNSIVNSHSVGKCRNFISIKKVFSSTMAIKGREKLVVIVK